jgi:hypothetical protein
MMCLNLQEISLNVNTLIEGEHMETFLEILSIIIYILCLPLLFILLVYIRINELLKGRS